MNTNKHGKIWQVSLMELQYEQSSHGKHSSLLKSTVMSFHHKSFMLLGLHIIFSYGPYILFEMYVLRLCSEHCQEFCYFHQYKCKVDKYVGSIDICGKLQNKCLYVSCVCYRYGRCHKSILNNFSHKNHCIYQNVSVADMLSKIIV